MSKNLTKNPINGIVFNIQRYCTHDGPGIRTVIFLKGCPLKCIWCHNPESYLIDKEISYIKSKCIFCHACEKACSNHAHTFKNGEHFIDRSKCQHCFECVKVCPSALSIVGERKTADEVMQVALKDKAFYGDNGGVTLSGGEPLFQKEFALELLKLAKINGVKTAIETCGFFNEVNLNELIKYTDIFLFDYKETNPIKHQQFTGQSNELILSNLYKIDEMGGKIILRCPIIKGFNDTQEHFNGIVNIANSLKNIMRVDIEPGHDIGKTKLETIGCLCNQIVINIPTKNDIDSWVSYIQKQTKIEVKIA